MRPKKEANRPDNKKVIFREAMRLFLEKGYSATTTYDICAAAGITKPTLYYYAKSKRHLFYLLHIEAIDTILKPHMKTAFSISDPLERLIFIIKDLTEIVCLHPELRCLLNETQSIRDQYFKGVRQNWKKHYLLLRDTISQIISSRELRTASKPSTLALLILGMIAWIPFWLNYDRKGRIHEISD
ncbi:MAG TPA: TetR/AcrR family transcriptional regulator, partial [Syntrophorhabdaceae bacterium]|nr:TetR/AcrR family transcriptional regulator [Syntrophorhabdaceae bacterium]